MNACLVLCRKALIALIWLALLLGGQPAASLYAQELTPTTCADSAGGNSGANYGDSVWNGVGGAVGGIGFAPQEERGVGGAAVRSSAARGLPDSLPR